MNINNSGPSKSKCILQKLINDIRNSSLARAAIFQQLTRTGLTAAELEPNRPIIVVPADGGWQVIERQVDGAVEVYASPDDGQPQTLWIVPPGDRPDQSCCKRARIFRIQGDRPDDELDEDELEDADELEESDEELDADNSEFFDEPEDAPENALDFEDVGEAKRKAKSGKTKTSKRERFKKEDEAKWEEIQKRYRSHVEKMIEGDGRHFTARCGSMDVFKAPPSPYPTHYVARAIKFLQKSENREMLEYPERAKARGATFIDEWLEAEAKDRNAITEEGDRLSNHVDLWSIRGTERFAMRNAHGGWSNVSRASAISLIKDATGCNTEISERIVSRIARDRNIDFCGLLAGLNAGKWIRISRRFIVTESPAMVVARKGDCAELLAIITKIFTDVNWVGHEKKQVGLFLYFLLRGRERIRYAFKRMKAGKCPEGSDGFTQMPCAGAPPIFVLGIGGAQSAGKSVLLKIIEAAWGHEAKNVNRYLSGSPFNPGMMGTCFWIMDDASPPKDRVDLNAKYKQIVGNDMISCEPKHVNEVDLPLVGNLVVCHNMEPENLKVFPDIASDNDTKFCLLKAIEGAGFTEDTFADDIEELIDQVPALLWHLENEIDWDEYGLESCPRFGKRAVIHPDIEELLHTGDPPHRLLTAIHTRIVNRNPHNMFETVTRQEVAERGDPGQLLKAWRETHAESNTPLLIHPTDQQAEDGSLPGPTLWVVGSAAQFQQALSLAGDTANSYAPNVVGARLSELVRRGTPGVLKIRERDPTVYAISATSLADDDEDGADEKEHYPV